MRKGRARRHFFIMLAIAAAFIIVLAIVPLLLPFDPNATNLALSLKAPGEAGFALGSDTLGRDVLAVRSQAGLNRSRSGLRSLR